jgi:DNA-binding NtrC family response regulator
MMVGTGAPAMTRDPSGQITDASSIVATPDTQLALTQATVIEGPDAGQVFALDPGAPSRLLVGTSQLADVRLTDRRVSRRHATLTPAGHGTFKLTDCGSTNGTFVDGLRIVEVYVRGGEIVRLGSTALRLDQQPTAAPPPLPNAMRFGLVLGASPAMRRLYPLCERIAQSKIPLVVEGETGTGKELLAESIHQVGGGKGPFVVFDCASVPPTLVESELFGYERGAFTGATTSRQGVFEEAHGGTLLIDEICDLDLAMQAKLLRALARGEVRRLGSQRPTHVDVRIIATTRRDIDRRTAEGMFRDDLLHRLAVARVELPPLRDREGDVALLARHFMKEMGGEPELAQDLVTRYGDHGWPGNVRELRNLVARFVTLGPEASPGDLLPDQLVIPVDVRAPYPVARRKTLAEFEQRYVELVLARHGGNVTQAAKASGLALRYFRMVRARQRR